MQRTKLIRRISNAVWLAAIVVGLSDRSLAQTLYLDWLDWHVVGTASWVTWGGTNTQITINRIYSTNTYEWAGFQGITGRANARATIGVNIQDSQTNSCSGVTVKLKLTHTGNTCQANTSCQTGANSREEMKVWDTCNGSNLNLFTSTWFGRVGDNPIAVSHAEVPVVPSAGVNCYTWQITVVDDFRSGSTQWCYAAYYN